MGFQQIHITPDQALKMSKQELAAIQKVLGIKQQVMSLLRSMRDHLENRETGLALDCYAQVQELEYQLQIEGLTEKLKQVESNVKQLESPISTSGPLLPPFPTPFPPPGVKR